MKSLILAGAMLTLATAGAAPGWHDRKVERFDRNDNGRIDPRERLRWP